MKKKGKTKPANYTLDDNLSMNNMPKGVMCMKYVAIYHDMRKGSRDPPPPKKNKKEPAHARKLVGIIKGWSTYTLDVDTHT